MGCRGVGSYTVSYTSSRDFYFDVSLILFALLLQFVLIPAGVDMGGAQDEAILLRPDFWPRVIAVVMFVAATAHLALGLYKGPPPAANAETAKLKIRPLGAAAIAGILVIILIAVRQNGLLLPAVACFLLAAFAIHPGKRMLKVGLAVAVPVAVLLFFERIANIPMPIGRALQGLIF